MVGTLNKRYALEHERKEYHIDNINDEVVHIGAWILESKIVRKNHLVQCNSGVIACVQQCA